MMKSKSEDIYKRALCIAAHEIAELRTVPINIEQICQQLGISIIRRRNQKEKALLEETLEGPRISLSALNNMPFKRFLIAHELGHFILNRELSVAPLGASEYWLHEILCNYFARLILLPDHYVQPLIRETRIALDEFLSLSDTLSRQAYVTWITAAYRITDIYPQFVFLDVRIGPQGHPLPKFSIKASTIPKNKVQGGGGKAFVESGLGILLSPLMRDSLRIVFGSEDLKNTRISKTYPVLSEVQAGIAVRHSEFQVRLALQLNGRPNNLINQTYSVLGQLRLFPIL